MATVTQLAPEPQLQAGTIHWLNTCIERGKSVMFSEATTLTPGLAAELIRRNPDNRGLRKTKAAQYANDIRAGKWELNGEAIIISRDGLLNDGQHRSLAVIEANLSIPVLFTFGVDRQTRTTLDQGGGRTASDYLAMQGVSNASVQASVARTLIAYDRTGGTSLNGVAYVTNRDVLDRVHSDPDVAGSAHIASVNAKCTKAYAPPAVIGFCHYIFNRISPLEANAYIAQVCRGEGLRAKDPAYTVRERLVSLTTKSREQKIHIIIRGWNAFRQGRTLSIAKLSGTENIPAAI